MDRMYVKTLEDYLVHAKFRQNPAEISLGSLERDKRSQARVLREAISEGYLEREPNENGYYTITPKAYDEIMTLPVDLVAQWNNRYGSSNLLECGNTPYLPVLTIFNYGNYLTAGHMKRLIEQPDTQWYLCDKDVFQYRGSHVKDHVQGPFSLEELRSMTINHMGCEILVSSQALRDHVKEIEIRRTAEEHYPKSLPWMLEKMKVVSEEKAERIKEVLPNLDAVHYDAFFAGTKKNVDWEENLGKSMDFLLTEIAEASEKLQLLLAVQRGVAAYGGWEKFLAESRVEFDKAIREHLEKKETPATAESE